MLHLKVLTCFNLFQSLALLDHSAMQTRTMAADTSPSIKPKEETDFMVKFLNSI